LDKYFRRVLVIIDYVAVITKKFESIPDVSVRGYNFKFSDPDITTNNAIALVTRQHCLDNRSSVLSVQMGRVEFLARFSTAFANTIPRIPFLPSKRLDSVPDSRSNIMMKFLDASFESRHWISPFLIGWRFLPECY